MIHKTVKEQERKYWHFCFILLHSCVFLPLFINYPFKYSTSIYHLHISMITLAYVPFVTASVALEGVPGAGVSENSMMTSTWAEKNEQTELLMSECLSNTNKNKINHYLSLFPLRNIVIFEVNGAKTNIIIITMENKDDKIKYTWINI